MLPAGGCNIPRQVGIHLPGKCWISLASIDISQGGAMKENIRLVSFN